MFNVEKKNKKEKKKKKKTNVGGWEGEMDNYPSKSIFAPFSPQFGKKTNPSPTPPHPTNGGPGPTKATPNQTLQLFKSV